MSIGESGGAAAAMLSVVGMIFLCLRTMIAAERDALARNRACERRRIADRAPFNDLR